jgi:hypothetical protein
VNLLIETDKARRTAEEAGRKDDLDKAQRDEKLFIAWEERENDMQKIILELQGSKVGGRKTRYGEQDERSGTKG